MVKHFAGVFHLKHYLVRRFGHILGKGLALNHRLGKKFQKMILKEDFRDVFSAETLDPFINDIGVIFEVS